MKCPIIEFRTHFSRSSRFQIAFIPNIDIKFMLVMIENLHVDPSKCESGFVWRTITDSCHSSPIIGIPSRSFWVSNTGIHSTDIDWAICFCELWRYSSEDRDTLKPPTLVLEIARKLSLVSVKHQLHNHFLRNRSRLGDSTAKAINVNLK
jgi:hypothetical protein